MPGAVRHDGVRRVMLIDGIAGLDGAARKVVIAGGGPVGLAVATDLARRGIPTLLLESGGASENPHVQSLSDAVLVDAARHDGMDVAVARRLGGSSNLWGGRCVPYDPVDFVARPQVDARWPIGAAEIDPYIARAVQAMQSGRPVFEAETALAPGADPLFSADRLERWVNTQAAQIIHREAIASSRHLEVRSHATMVGISFRDGGRVDAIDVAHSLSGERVRVPVERLVIAAGGLETTRLLLASTRDAPQRFGGADGPLGRYYMGHAIGEIADIVFSSRALAEAFDFGIDRNGSYVRRRIAPAAATQIEHGLLNSAFWPIVPPVADPSHGSAILSLVYLALCYPRLGRLLVAEAIRRRHIPEGRRPLAAHLRNLVTGAPAALVFAASFLRRRYAQEARLPGFFVLNRANRYGLSYHAEHAPNAASRVWLAGGKDRLGLPTLTIDLRFSAVDAASVVRTHDLLGGWLERNRLGRIAYRVPVADREAGVLAQASHGTHQIGLTRMAPNPRQGIVDGDLLCFGTPNLYLASCGVLPTSSQANPTLTAVALALRLADSLAEDISADGIVLRDAAIAR